MLRNALHRFNLQLDLAEKYNLPVLVHTRESIQDTYDILKKKHSMYCLNDKLEGNSLMIKLAIKSFEIAMEKSYPNKTKFEISQTNIFERMNNNK